MKTGNKKATVLVTVILVCVYNDILVCKKHL